MFVPPSKRSVQIIFQTMVMFSTGSTAAYQITYQDTQQDESKHGIYFSDPAVDELNTSEFRLLNFNHICYH